jgi:hypothetical protein
MEKLIHMGEEGCPIFTINENIINENKYKLMEKRRKYIIHETLKSGRGITEAKGHDQELIVALMSSKCIIGNVLFFHMDVVVARTKIKFSKVLSTTQFI